MITTINPAGSMDLLSQLEVERLKKLHLVTSIIYIATVP
ncbi:hypothetical protein JCM19232_6247 [Vibrio ishigakensis]|uniref:Decarboxylase family protein n=1 Tax=Vibrio ishigakensis TaxID=1481914 RepID=A0A0B8PBM4_9VIBR|nr:hypothetical protein JCM19232_6247 [Vibrio ishigakensis]GAM69156.1 decarboxylase family protein [Vibrio sp. JCM 19236]GAM73005.1 decarboxylase family protein [Vibrio ishigakensis]